ncbi:putative membrane protein [Campylobacter pinnipediorum subsp. pinnipediorum]|nr:putative membrane protein [Campylobacter pinnipediorum subsp. pinnipediorum]
MGDIEEKATEIFDFSCFLLIINYGFNAAFIETLSSSTAIALAIYIVNGRAFSFITFLIYSMLYLLWFYLKNYSYISF